MQVRPFLEAFVEPEAFCFLACFHADRQRPCLRTCVKAVDGELFVQIRPWRTTNCIEALA